ncbi:MAG: hypothetical protein ACM3SU_17855 [Acidobacteriota bacterium]
MKVHKTADHEVLSLVVHEKYEPSDRLVLPEPTGGRSVWTVLASERDPHGWKVTAVRCLDSCRSRHRRS